MVEDCEVVISVDQSIQVITIHLFSFVGLGGRHEAYPASI